MQKFYMYVANKDSTDKRILQPKNISTFQIAAPNTHAHLIIFIIKNSMGCKYCT